MDEEDLVIHAVVVVKLVSPPFAKKKGNGCPRMNELCTRIAQRYNLAIANQVLQGNVIVFVIRHLSLEFLRRRKKHKCVVAVTMSLANRVFVAKLALVKGLVPALRRGEAERILGASHMLCRLDHLVVKQDESFALKGKLDRIRLLLVCRHRTVQVTLKK